MAILAECPICHTKQKVKNKVCKCGHKLDKAKRSKKVRYWVSYYLPNGKQRREICDRENPYSIEIAQAAHGKRVAQKFETPSILERLPEETMTMSQLGEWFLEVFAEKVKIEKLRDSKRAEGCLANFNKVYGDRIVRSITVEDLQRYQRIRTEDGRASSTVDKELTFVKAMIDEAFENRKVSGETLRVFKSRKVKRLLKGAGNARARTLTIAEYVGLKREAPAHLRAMITVDWYTGMRTGEIHKLRWSYIDQEKGFIRLPAEVTKEKKPKNIPMNRHVKEVLLSLPRAMHHDYVFTYNGDPIATADGHKRSFKTACKEAGIPYGIKTPDGITFRDIRTTVKTNMLSAGVDKIYRDIILGHSLVGMDQYYMKPSEEDLHGAMKKYTLWIDDQIAIIDQTIDQVNKGPNY